MSEEINRGHIIVRTSLIGIAANVVLVIFKALVGLAANSIAIILDAVNNLTDVLSNVITIVGTRLANREPDKDHPIGHGRWEYITTMVVAVIILYAGVAALVESVKKIIHPVAVNYSTVTLVVLIAAIAVKLVLGVYVSNQGKRVRSGALEGSGLDALYDAVISTSVLVAALIYVLTGWSIEAWIGVAIAGFIIKAGIEMIMGAVNAVLGERVNSNLSKAIKRTVTAEPGVMGAYDLFLNDYGPEKYFGSVHVEVDENMTAAEIDVMTHHIKERVMKRHGVTITTVGIYAYNTTNKDAIAKREEVRALVMAHEGVLQMHGFYANEADQVMHFDVIISFSVEDREALHAHIIEDVKRRYPGWAITTNLDVDLSD